MRWLAPFLLVLAACNEPTANLVTPLDRFAMPATVALSARADGGYALLVASGNYDLTYDGPGGGTILSVDPSLADNALGTGGSAGRTGGALVKYGEGAHVGSYAGQMVVVDERTCPGPDAASKAREVYLATRYAGELWRLPVGADGQVDPCTGTDCVVPVNKSLVDGFGLALACRPDGQRRSLFQSFLRTSTVGYATAAWLAEVDLDAPMSTGRIYPISLSALGGMAYLAETDQLLVVGRPLLSAPIYILDLGPCASGLSSCPTPVLSQVNVVDAQAGLDLQAIALSNPQPGLGRRAYVSARVYDANVAGLIGGRPSTDIMGALLVLDLEPDQTGRPSLKVLQRVQTGMGASQVQVLPVRDAQGGPPRRDVVVVSSVTDGIVTVYDDETGRVARYLPVDDQTGAPEAGREPFGLAAYRIPGATPAEDVARVFVAASRQEVVGVIDVPLDAPTEAHALRDAAGALVRIGGLQ